MNRNQILEFVAKNPLFALATIEGGAARVRMMMLCSADENGLVFSTGTDKEVHSQMLADPAVEMCFYSADEQKQVRITGRVQLLEDMELKKRIVDDFPFLKPWVKQHGYDSLAPWCMKNGKAVAWTMETDSAPKQYVEI